MEEFLQKLKGLTFGDLGKEERDGLERLIGEMEPSLVLEDSDPLILLYDLYRNASSDEEACKIREAARAIAVGMQVAANAAKKQHSEPPSKIHLHAMAKLPKESHELPQKIEANGKKEQWLGRVHDIHNGLMAKRKSNDWFGEIKDPEKRDSVRGEIAAAYAAGNVDKATERVVEQFGKAETEEGFDWKTGMALGYAAAGNDAKVKEWIGKIKGDGVLNETKAEIAVVYATHGKDAKVAGWVGEINSSGKRDEARGRVAEAYAVAGKDAKMYEWFREIKDADMRNDVRGRIAAAYATAGNDAKVNEWFGKIRAADKQNISKQLDIAVKQEFASKNIAIGYAVAGKDAKVAEWYGKLTQPIVGNRIEDIAAAYAAAGNDAKVKEWIGKIEADERQFASENIAIGYASVGNYAKVDEWFGKIKVAGRREYTRENIAVAYAKVAIKARKQQLPLPSADEAAEWISGQLVERKTELAIVIGALAGNDERGEIAKLIPERHRKVARLLMDYGRATLTYPDEIGVGEKAALFKAYAKDLAEFAANPAAHPPNSLEITVKMLQSLDSAEVKAQFLAMAREEKFAAGRLRLLEALIELGHLKGSDLALQVAADESLNPHASRYLFAKLSAQGYIDKELGKYLKGKDSGYYLGAMKKLVNTVGIQPDERVLRYFTQQEGKKIIDLDARATELKGMVGEFNQTKNKDELLKILAKNQKKLTLYYMIFGVKTRYSLVNRYDTGKLGYIVNKASELEEAPEPLNKFGKVLKVENKKEILQKLKDGKWPLGSESVWNIRLDIAQSRPLEEANRRLAEVLGRDEIGAVLKYAAYIDYLKNADAPLAGKFASANGLLEVASLVREAETKHPKIANEIETLREKWKKLQEKEVLNLTLKAVCENERNPIDVGGLFDGLEGQRKELLNRFRQEYKSGNIGKMARDERVQAIEEKGRAKLMRYVLGEVVSGGAETGNERLEMLLSEWESHLNEPFENYEKALREGRFKIEKKAVLAQLRWLDKKEDLIECFRIADSAQCCFKSDNYETHDAHGAADWIARLWKDPLSFMFQVEEPTGSGKAFATGFVFGSFGIVRGKLAVLLNGVYLKDKSPEATESILYAIEREFSRPLGAGWQVAASRYGGSSKMPAEYTKRKFKVERLRAIGRGGWAETEVYDDLGVGCNEVNGTDGNVWRKKL